MTPITSSGSLRDGLEITVKCHVREGESRPIPFKNGLSVRFGSEDSGTPTFQFSQVSSIVSRSAAVASSASQSYATILVPAATARNTNSAAANPPCNDRRKKASSEKRKNDRFVEPDVFRPGTVGGWGEIAKPPACMQKPRSTNWPNGRCVRGKPGLARAAATAIENQKPFDLSWQQGGSWQNCEVCQAVRNYTRGRASNASRQWPRRPDC